MTNILIENVERGLRDLVTMPEEGKEKVAEIIRKANQILQERYSDLFPDPEYYMEGPVSIIKDTVVEARVRRLAARYEFYKPEDSPAEFTDMMLETVVCEAATEFEFEIAMLAKEGKRFCPYVPLTFGGFVVDPVSYNVVMSLNTRYGILEEQA